MAKETRPRSVVMNSGLLVVLRGINMNPGAVPEDMVSIRLWIEKNRIISFRRRRLLTLKTLTTAIEQKRGPRTAGEFLTYVANMLVDRMDGVVNTISDHVDKLESETLQTGTRELRAKLANVRRQIISLHRYLTPQRDVMSHLQIEKVAWLTDLDRMNLRELGDRTSRYIEDLDVARDRAAVTQEELTSYIAE